MMYLVQVSPDSAVTVHIILTTHRFYDVRPDSSDSPYQDCKKNTRVSISRKGRRVSHLIAAAKLVDNIGRFTKIALEATSTVKSIIKLFDEFMGGISSQAAVCFTQVVRSRVQDT